ncbi:MULTISPECIES: alpha/beta hydrolase [unclassified Brevundimonas]|uniref:alpha/beta hydrolase n=1 Tax=unclassified Brevundimonas TaxID=2622653 RepID=UPI000CFE19F8|nr:MULTISPECIES: dienelactone hydrolase family protein [unclassified Brevundimonas]PRA36030.1 esterase [Brevundimonas sp. MYb27]PQZ84521.1 esterase [Brevundimonas sp. MYb31]PRB17756.1 esterase [Brevundimonas sp. MYb52]PRB38127.1 esterase [Brevundimonas sp. MYb46]PRB56091.1 esterase [Brevundimonas sp. MYb33]
MIDPLFSPRSGSRRALLVSAVAAGLVLGPVSSAVASARPAAVVAQSAAPENTPVQNAVTTGAPAPLYPNMRPTTAEIAFGAPGDAQIRNVTVPTLTPYLPAPGTATGAAVIVAPGGGFMLLAIENEGEAVARALAARGVTAFVLKYRTDVMSEDRAAFAAEAVARITAYVRAKKVDSRQTPFQSPFKGQAFAEADQAQALKLVRERANEWGVDPKRVGILGFSAGAIAITDLVSGSTGARPDFVGLVYGNYDRPIPTGAPPAFIAMAADDPLQGVRPAQDTYAAWTAAGAPAELHLYERGGHGFGMRQQGASSDGWFDAFIRWMGSRGLLAERTTSD